ncbi:hypothetical protein FNF27_07873 [Cafeteria roenbergensis]|uniref:Uncharacterized protein n=1 Tax=Cafeteria roenbergensis TaxID=33653 RepID=A0A5A8DF13_CAFRO|nr:hypothetical protein FNF27_07873 [Cafeteria roenbergensis]
MPLGRIAVVAQCNPLTVGLCGASGPSGHWFDPGSIGSDTVMLDTFTETSVVPVMGLVRRDEQGSDPDALGSGCWDWIMAFGAKRDTTELLAGALIPPSTPSTLPSGSSDDASPMLAAAFTTTSKNGNLLGPPAEVYNERLFQIQLADKRLLYIVARPVYNSGAAKLSTMPAAEDIGVRMYLTGDGISLQSGVPKVLLAASLAPADSSAVTLTQPRLFAAMNLAAAANSASNAELIRLNYNAASFGHFEKGRGALTLLSATKRSGVADWLAVIEHGVEANSYNRDEIGALEILATGKHLWVAGLTPAAAGRAYARTSLGSNGQVGVGVPDFGSPLRCDFSAVSGTNLGPRPFLFRFSAASGAPPEQCAAWVGDPAVTTGLAGTLLTSATFARINFTREESLASADASIAPWGRGATAPQNSPDGLWGVVVFCGRLSRAAYAQSQGLSLGKQSPSYPALPANLDRTGSLPICVAVEDSSAGYGAGKLLWQRSLGSQAGSTDTATGAVAGHLATGFSEPAAWVGATEKAAPRGQGAAAGAAGGDDHLWVSVNLKMSSNTKCYVDSTFEVEGLCSLSSYTAAAPVLWHLGPADGVTLAVEPLGDPGDRASDTANILNIQAGCLLPALASAAGGSAADALAAPVPTGALSASLLLVGAYPSTVAAPGSRRARSLRSCSTQQANCSSVPRTSSRGQQGARRLAASRDRWGFDGDTWESDQSLLFNIGDAKLKGYGSSTVALLLAIAPRPAPALSIASLPGLFTTAGRPLTMRLAVDGVTARLALSSPATALSLPSAAQVAVPSEAGLAASTRLLLRDVTAQVEAIEPPARARLSPVQGLAVPGAASLLTAASGNDTAAAGYAQGRWVGPMAGGFLDALLPSPALPSLPTLQWLLVAVEDAWGRSGSVVFPVRVQPADDSGLPLPPLAAFALPTAQSQWTTRASSSASFHVACGADETSLKSATEDIVREAQADSAFDLAGGSDGIARLLSAVEWRADGGEWQATQPSADASMTPLCAQYHCRDPLTPNEHGVLNGCMQCERFAAAADRAPSGTFSPALSADEGTTWQSWLVEVRCCDSEGSCSRSPASLTLVHDAVPPVAQVEIGPAAYVRSTTAKFELGCSKHDASGIERTPAGACGFRYRLGMAPFAELQTTAFTLIEGSSNATGDQSATLADDIGAANCLATRVEVVVDVSADETTPARFRQFRPLRSGEPFVSPLTVLADESQTGSVVPLVNSTRVGFRVVTAAASGEFRGRLSVDTRAGAAGSLRAGVLQGSGLAEADGTGAFVTLAPANPTLQPDGRTWSPTGAVPAGVAFASEVVWLDAALSGMLGGTAGSLSAVVHFEARASFVDEWEAFPGRSESVGAGASVIVDTVPPLPRITSLPPSGWAYDPVGGLAALPGAAPGFGIGSLVVPAAGAAWESPAQEAGAWWGSGAAMATVSCTVDEDRLLGRPSQVDEWGQADPAGQPCIVKYRVNGGLLRTAIAPGIPIVGSDVRDGLNTIDVEQVTDALGNIGARLPGLAPIAGSSARPEVASDSAHPNCKVEAVIQVAADPANEVRQAVDWGGIELLFSSSYTASTNLPSLAGVTITTGVAPGAGDSARIVFSSDQDWSDEAEVPVIAAARSANDSIAAVPGSSDPQAWSFEYDKDRGQLYGAFVLLLRARRDPSAVRTPRKLHAGLSGIGIKLQTWTSYTPTVTATIVEIKDGVELTSFGSSRAYCARSLYWVSNLRATMVNHTVEANATEFDWVIDTVNPLSSLVVVAGPGAEQSAWSAVDPYPAGPSAAQLGASEDAQLMAGAVNATLAQQPGTLEEATARLAQFTAQHAGSVLADATPFELRGSAQGDRLSCAPVTVLSRTADAASLSVSVRCKDSSAVSIVASAAFIPGLVLSPEQAAVAAAGLPRSAFATFSTLSDRVALPQAGGDGVPEVTATVCLPRLPADTLTPGWPQEASSGSGGALPLAPSAACQTSPALEPRAVVSAQQLQALGVVGLEGARLAIASPELQVAAWLEAGGGPSTEVATAQGTLLVRAVAEDAAGNTEANVALPATAAVAVDRSPPAVTTLFAASAIRGDTLPAMISIDFVASEPRTWAVIALAEARTGTQIGPTHVVAAPGPNVTDAASADGPRRWRLRFDISSVAALLDSRGVGQGPLTEAFVITSAGVDRAGNRGPTARSIGWVDRELPSVRCLSNASGAHGFITSGDSSVLAAAGLAGLAPLQIPVISTAATAITCLASEPIAGMEARVRAGYGPAGAGDATAVPPAASLARAIVASGAVQPAVSASDLGTPLGTEFAAMYVATDLEALASAVSALDPSANPQPPEHPFTLRISGLGETPQDPAGRASTPGTLLVVELRVTDMAGNVGAWAPVPLVADRSGPQLSIKGTNRGLSQQCPSAWTSRFAANTLLVPAAEAALDLPDLAEDDGLDSRCARTLPLFRGMSANGPLDANTFFGDQRMGATATVEVSGEAQSLAQASMVLLDEDSIALAAATPQANGSSIPSGLGQQKLGILLGSNEAGDPASWRGGVPASGELVSSSASSPYLVAAQTAAAAAHVRLQVELEQAAFPFVGGWSTGAPAPPRQLPAQFVDSFPALVTAQIAWPLPNETAMRAAAAATSLVPGGKRGLALPAQEAVFAMRNGPYLMSTWVAKLVVSSAGAGGPGSTAGVGAARRGVLAMAVTMFDAGGVPADRSLAFPFVLDRDPPRARLGCAGSATFCAAISASLAIDGAQLPLEAPAAESNGDPALWTSGNWTTASAEASGLLLAGAPATLDWLAAGGLSSSAAGQSLLRPPFPPGSRVPPAVQSLDQASMELTAMCGEVAPATVILAQRAGARWQPGGYLDDRCVMDVMIAYRRHQQARTPPPIRTAVVYGAAAGSLSRWTSGLGPASSGYRFAADSWRDSAPAANKLKPTLPEQQADDAGPSDGLYAVRVRGVDAAGNPGAWTDWLRFAVDTVAPSAVLLPLLPPPVAVSDDTVALQRAAEGEAGSAALGAASRRGSRAFATAGTTLPGMLVTCGEAALDTGGELSPLSPSDLTDLGGGCRLQMVVARAVLASSACGPTDGTSGSGGGGTGSLLAGSVVSNGAALGTEVPAGQSWLTLRRGGEEPLYTLDEVTPAELAASAAHDAAEGFGEAAPPGTPASVAAFGPLPTVASQRGLTEPTALLATPGLRFFRLQVSASLAGSDDTLSESVWLRSVDAANNVGEAVPTAMRRDATAPPAPEARTTPAEMTVSLTEYRYELWSALSVLDAVGTSIAPAWRTDDAAVDGSLLYGLSADLEARVTSFQGAGMDDPEGLLPGQFRALPEACAELEEAVRASDMAAFSAAQADPWEGVFFRFRATFVGAAGNYPLTVAPAGAPAAGEYWACATGPLVLKGLPEGTTSIRVKAVDAAGNEGPSRVFSTVVSSVTPTSKVLLAPPAITSLRRLALRVQVQLDGESAPLASVGVIHRRPEFTEGEVLYPVQTGGEPGAPSLATVVLSSLEVGRHSVSVFARMGDISESADSRPAAVEFEIADCSATEHEALDASGKLICAACPPGADCSHPRTSLGNMPALPGWWSSGKFFSSAKSARRFYRCATKSACPGGMPVAASVPAVDPPALLQEGSALRELFDDVLPPGSELRAEALQQSATAAALRGEDLLLFNETETGHASTAGVALAVAEAKARLAAAAANVSTCGFGHSGLLCSQCEDGFFLSFQQCTACPPERSQAFAMTAGIVVAMGVLALVFLRLRKFLPIIQAKVLLAFAQILAATVTAYDIPWPVEFADTVNSLRIFVFDLVQATRVQCTQPVGYLESFHAQVSLPLGVAVLLGIVGAGTRCKLRSRAAKCASALGCFASVTASIRGSSSLAQALSVWQVSFTQGGGDEEQAGDADEHALLPSADVLKRGVSNPLLRSRGAVSLEGAEAPASRRATRLASIMLRCVDVDGERRLLADLRQPCSGVLFNTHEVYAVAVLIGFTAGFPVALVLYIRRNLVSLKQATDQLQQELDEAEEAAAKSAEDELFGALALPGPKRARPELRSAAVASPGSLLQSASLGRHGGAATGTADRMAFAPTGWAQRDLFEIRERHAVMLRVGSMYEGYTPRAYWWEAEELLRRLALSALIVLVPSGSSLQVAVAALLAAVVLALLNLVEPYQDPSAQRLQQLAFATILFVFWTGMLLKTDAAAAAERAAEGGATDVDFTTDRTVLGWIGYATVLLTAATIVTGTVLFARDTARNMLAASIRSAGRPGRRAAATGAGSVARSQSSVAASDVRGPSGDNAGPHVIESIGAVTFGLRATLNPAAGPPPMGTQDCDAGRSASVR